MRRRGPCATRKMNASDYTSQRPDDIGATALPCVPGPFVSQRSTNDSTLRLDDLFRWAVHLRPEIAFRVIAPDLVQGVRSAGLLATPESSRGGVRAEGRHSAPLTNAIPSGAMCGCVVANVARTSIAWQPSYFDRDGVRPVGAGGRPRFRTAPHRTPDGRSKSTRRQAAPRSNRSSPLRTEQRAARPRTDRRAL
jgi:hypothetical protein